MSTNKYDNGPTVLEIVLDIFVIIFLTFCFVYLCLLTVPQVLTHCGRDIYYQHGMKDLLQLCALDMGYILQLINLLLFKLNSSLSVHRMANLITTKQKSFHVN